MSRVEPNRNVYVGHRYVPKIFGEWDKKNEYEGLSIVTYKGNSYTSKKRVPVGIEILNEEFWVVTGNYNAQVEYYRDETRHVADDLEQTKTDMNQRIDDSVEYVDSNVNDLTVYVNDEIRQNKEYVDDEIRQNKEYVDDEVRQNKEYVDGEVSNMFEALDNVSTELEIERNKIDWVSVENFPIVPPESDDSGRIQRATNTGKSVYFPDGEYIALNIKPVSGMHWWGSGKAVIKLPEGTEEGSILYHGSLNHKDVSYGEVPSIDNVTLENITLDSNGASDLNTRLVTLVNPYNIYFNNVNFNIAYTGVLLSTNGINARYENNHNVNFIKSKFTQNDISVSLGYGINTEGAIHGVNIDNTEFIDMRVTSGARVFESDPINGTVYSSSNWNFTNNKFKNLKDPAPIQGTAQDVNGLYIRGIFFNISGNEFYGVEGNNIDAQNTQPYDNVVRNELNSMRFITITNNRFILKDEHNFQGEAILHLRNSHLIVSNNSFYIDCTSDHKTSVTPIVSKWGNRIQIVGNSFKTFNIRETIFINSTETYNINYDDVIISNNAFEGNIVPSYGSVKLGATGNSSIKKAIIQGNTFKGNNNCVECHNTLQNGSYGKIEHLVFKNNSYEVSNPFTFRNGSPLKIDSDYFGDYVFYVDSENGNDDNARLTDSTTPAKTINRITSMLPDICQSKQIEIILLDGHYPEIAFRENLIMNGTLIIKSESGNPVDVEVNRITFNDSIITNLLIENITTTSDSYGFSLSGFKGTMYIKNNRLYGRDGINLLHCNDVVIEDSEFNNTRRGINASHLSNVFSYNNTGSSDGNNLVSGRGSTIVAHGTQPTGETLEQLGGVIRETL